MALRLALVAATFGLRGTADLVAADPAPVEGWHSLALGLRLVAPTGWSLAPGPSADSVLMVPSRGKGQIALLSLPLAATDAGAESSLDGLVDAALLSLKEKVDGFKLLERRAAGVAKLPAQEIYFRGKVERDKYRWIQTIFVHESKQVILMYTAPDDSFPQFLGDYDQVVRSVMILP